MPRLVNLCFLTSNGWRLTGVYTSHGGLFGPQKLSGALLYSVKKSGELLVLGVPEGMISARYRTEMQETCLDRVGKTLFLTTSA